MERDEARLDGGTGVVVGPVADVRDLVGGTPDKVDEVLEEPRIRLPDSEARRARDEIDGKRLSGPRFERRRLVAGDPHDEPRCAQGAQARARIGIEIIRRVGECLRRLGPLDAQVPPKLPVLLSPLDRLAERSPDDLSGETCGSGKRAPVALLVDEGLPDVEEDRADAHDPSVSSSRCDRRSRSSAVVTFARSGSPSTTAIRPPCRSTSDAQSVAPARSAANAARSGSARKTCGV